MVKWLMLISVFSVSCGKIEEFKQNLDQMSFSLSGGTLFSEPTLVTTKEIHFDTGKLLGREVILEGEIVSLGKFDTHLVVSDGSGRMLVVLTHIESANTLLKDSTDLNLRVLGTIERGKKGLPYILARSINVYTKESKK